FYRGEISADQQALLKPFDESPANVFVTPINLDADENKTNERVQALWGVQKSPTLPWMVLMYPNTYDPKSFVWAGPVNKAAVDMWLGSPMRADIASRLVKGDSAVWVLLESGDKAKDDAAAKLINEQLRVAEKELELPEQIDNSPYANWDSPAAQDLKIKFSLVRLDRSDPKEKGLIEMLLNSEADLKDFDDPIAFPVYGRGRALFALVGPGINEQNIADTCLFLTGACSCQVKELNPGTDLLMNVDWDKAVWAMLTTDIDVPELPGAAEMIPVADDGSAADKSVPAAATSPAAEVVSADLSSADESVPVATDTAEKKSDRLVHNLLIAVAATIVVVAVGSMLLLKREIA
ncbi:MAG: hypothetical protein J7M12_00790, partial [Candidatus Hydrogenedentes bacterium]|nr:hypothetical protein [Candidatus Hydrogenedentota bacterium]